MSDPRYPPYARGTLIQSKDGVIGALTGGTRRCQLEGCTGRRLGARWSDGRHTFPCTKGMTYLEALNQWRIE